MSEKGRILLWAAVNSLWWPWAVAAEPLYSIVPIPAPAVGLTRNAGGSAINDLGEVMGTYGVFDSMGNQTAIRTFHYSDGVGSVDIPVPQTWNLFAGGIDNSGQMAVYGAERGPGAQFRAYRYSQTRGFEPLGTFGGTQTEAAGINSSGQVTGFSSTLDGHNHAYHYTDGVGLENIGSAFGSSVGYPINDRGWVAGYGDGNAVLFRDEGDIVLLPGVGRGINSAGNVVGDTSIVPGHPTAFVYLDGRMLILGDAVFTQTVLHDINNQNLAVGIAFLEGILRPVLWSEAQLGGPNAGLVDLNTLLPQNSGWTLIGASAINDRGQITGSGLFNGEFMAFRLDPIPEPSTWVLLALGGGLFCLVRCRARDRT
jgi:probable HAF family extracellular repeat protein